MAGVDYLPFLYQAATSPVGVAVRGGAFTVMRQEALQIRKLVNDPLLSGLQFLASPDDPERELWIVRKDVKKETRGRKPKGG